MPLSAHVTPRIVVPLLDGNDVAVRGLNLDDLTALMPEHFEAVSKIAVLYGQHKQSVFSSKAFADFVISIARDFPNIIAEVISIASDEPEAKKVKLGSGLQISVLSAVLKLTVEEAGGLGNLFGQLQTLGQNVLAAQQELADASKKAPRSSGSTGGGART